MTPERWQQIRDIAYAALDRQPQDRPGLLDERCGNDAELRRDVVAMMADAAREDADSMLDPPAWELIGLPAVLPINRLDGVRADWMPEAIGSYRIHRLVGEGGMGVVYEAEQVEPARTVALKVIRPGLATPEVLRRFRQESRALGRLQHPGIAQIYEAGTADSGFGPQPYFAMEFIRGETLTDYATSRRLGVGQRLDLMAKICDAVDHAHQRGLIHRDLKPANVLVDGTGQPKILDFGVARVTDGDIHRTQQTDVGQLIGTLAYMSPEQVLADPLELDIRSDVYSLGVMLYELLAGSLPYDISRQVHEAIRTIQQEDPKPLSAINRSYRGDLETIAAKALEKEKANRYGSAGALAADIRRHLHDEPIVARPPSASYHLRKFARRHRALVGGMVAVFVVLAAGAAATAREAIRARRAERAAVEAEQTVQAVNAFLQNDLLAQASSNAQATPDTRPDPDLKVRTALDRAAATVGDKFAGRPVVEASIRRTIGRTYRDLGLFPEAQTHLERALELQRGISVTSDPEMLELLDDLANLYYQRGKYDLTIPIASQILEIRRRAGGEEHPATLLAMGNLGLVHSFAGKDALAAPLLEKSLEGRLRVSGESDPETQTAMMNLALVYDRQGKDSEAEKLYRRSLEISRRIKGEEHPDTLTNMNNLAAVYRDLGKWAEAEAMLNATLAGRRRVLGPEHPGTLTATNNLANLYLDLGKSVESEGLFSELLQTRVRVLGESHQNTLLTMNNLARVRRFRGDYLGAEALLTRALELQRETLGPEHPDAMLVLSNLGTIQNLLGRHAQARRAIEEALSLRTTVLGPDHPDALFERERLADIAESEGQYADAEQRLTTVLETRARVLGQEHRDTLRTRMAVGRVQLAQRRYRDAAASLRAALAGYQKSQPDSWLRFGCQGLLGASLARLTLLAEALPMLHASYEGLTRLRATIPVSDLHHIGDVALLIGDVYKQSGDPVRALEWSRKPRR